MNSSVFSKIFIVLFAFSVLGYLFFNVFSKSDLSSSRVGHVVREGDIIPVSMFQSMDGESLKLSSKITVIHFWATWCGPCAEELPTFQHLITKFSNQLQVFAISQDDSINEIHEFMKSSKNLTFQPDFKVIPDFQHQIGSQFKILALPESYIVNQQGVVIRKVVGALDWSSKEVDQFFHDLLVK